MSDSVLVQWKNKKLDKDEKGFSYGWHFYQEMKRDEAEEFLRSMAPRSYFFAFRICPTIKPITNQIDETQQTNPIKETK